MVQLQDASYYTEGYYRHQQGGAVSSAQVIVPQVLQLVQPHSVVDVGCGVGAWLSVFQAQGITDYVGVDGPYIKPNMLKIPADHFQPGDLRQPLDLGRTFDLAVCLEVAEHLPATAAETVVQSLTNLAPVILFSAAVPFQGGRNHINEQWPEYWQEKFSRQGYEVVDCLRRSVWNNPKVDWWYAQNILIYVRKDRLEQIPALQEARKNTNLEQLAVIHPRSVELCISKKWAMLPGWLLRAVRRIGGSGSRPN